jgi:hypothetical protein
VSTCSFGLIHSHLINTLYSQIERNSFSKFSPFVRKLSAGSSAEGDSVSLLSRIISPAPVSSLCHSGPQTPKLRLSDLIPLNPNNKDHSKSFSL